MRYSEETLMAFADGELDAGTSAEIEAAATADPAIAATIARHRSTRALLRQGFDPVLEEPVPRRLFDSLESTGARKHGTAGIVRLPSRPRSWSWPEWGAIAATLLMGALIGSAMRTAPVPLLEHHADRLVAAGALSEALSAKLAQDYGPGDEIRPGLSFRTAAGDYCRTFAVGSTSGLACREPDRWRIEMLATVPARGTDDYRLAGGELPGVILDAVEARIKGEPFDAAEEAAARERGWRD